MFFNTAMQAGRRWLERDCRRDAAATRRFGSKYKNVAVGVNTIREIHGMEIPRPQSLQGSVVPLFVLFAYSSQVNFCNLNIACPETMNDFVFQILLSLIRFQFHVICVIIIVLKIYGSGRGSEGEGEIRCSEPLFC